MRRVFLSFLGLGTDKKEKGVFRYDPTVYTLDGRKSGVTEFVQVAEMELLGPDRFDIILVVATNESHETHFKKSLVPQMTALNAPPMVPILISDDMDPAGQWGWLERILAYIEPGDELTVDITHGYRSIPIIFSSAIHFLQRARNITLAGVYYGAYDKDRKLVPIVDMKDFYLINEWAEAVSRLVEDADTRKLADVAARSPAFQAGELQDPAFVEALDDLTDAIRNVDVNHVCEKAEKALELVEAKRKRATPTGRMLLDLVVDKFTMLSGREGSTGRYDLGYFSLQVELIRILLEHKLYMQAYTVMRELIGAIGMLGIPHVRVLTSEGRKKRGRYGEVFIRMMQFQEEKWTFDEKTREVVQELMPFYTRLIETGAEQILQTVVPDLIQIRNGFDHGWTLKSSVEPEIQKLGSLYLGKIENVLSLLDHEDFFIDNEKL